jgi:hypothetical protein
MRESVESRAKKAAGEHRVLRVASWMDDDSLAEGVCYVLVKGGAHLANRLIPFCFHPELSESQMALFERLVCDVEPAKALEAVRALGNEG